MLNKRNMIFSSLNLNTKNSALTHVGVADLSACWERRLWGNHAVLIYLLILKLKSAVLFQI